MMEPFSIAELEQSPRAKIMDQTSPPSPLAGKIIHRSSGDAQRSQNLGPYRIETLIAEAEEGAGTCYRVGIAPHQTTAVSYHRVAEEFYFVLSGRGLAILDGQSYPLAPGDFLRLPPGTTHAFVTSEESLELLDIHTPGCRPNKDTFFQGPSPQGFSAQQASGAN